MLPVLQRFFAPGQKPYVCGITTATSTGTPITMTYPERKAGTLIVALICRHAGGTAAPGLSAAFTSIGTSTVDPDYRTEYKFLDGSEGRTFTSSATSATSMSAIVYAICGAHSSVPPIEGGVATATSTTPNPALHNTGQNYAGRNLLRIPYAMWNGSATVSEYPANYCNWQSYVTEGVNGGMAAIVRNTSLNNEDVGPFTISASLVNRAGVIVVPGFV